MPEIYIVSHPASNHLFPATAADNKRDTVLRYLAMDGSGDLLNEVAAMMAARGYKIVAAKVEEIGENNATQTRKRRHSKTS